MSTLKINLCKMLLLLSWLGQTSVTIITRKNLFRLIPTSTWD